MECERCNKPMILENFDNRDHWICKHCQISFLVNPKKDCEHDNILFGVDGFALCDDCKMRLAYKLNQNFMEPDSKSKVKGK